MAPIRKKKLGETLIEAGAISPEQLQKALEAQVVFGGRLGTNLVELDFITLDRLANQLSAYYDYPNALPDSFSEAESELLEKVSATLCAKHEIFPLYLDNGKVLYLAMVDPSRLDVIDQLSFSLRCRIQPFSTPELRLRFFLERRYGLKRDARYVRLANQAAGPPAGAGAERRRYLQPLPNVPALELGNDEVSVEVVFDAPSTSFTSEHKVVSDDDGLVFLDQVSFAPSATSNPPLILRTPTPTATTPDPLSETPSMDDPSAVARIMGAMARSTTPDELSEALVGVPIAGCNLSTLFMIRAEVAIARESVGTKCERGYLRQLTLSLAVPSLFQDAFASRDIKLSDGQPDPLQRMVAGYLNTPMPRAACVVPIVVGARVVNLLSLQSQRAGVFHEQLASLERLAKAAQDAYVRLIQRHKGASFP